MTLYKGIFVLYGFPFGKSTLVRELLKYATDFKVLKLKFLNPESPETTLDKVFANFNWDTKEQLLIVIEKFWRIAFVEGNERALTRN